MFRVNETGMNEIYSADVKGSTGVFLLAQKEG
jgi:hypothetical protein